MKSVLCAFVTVVIALQRAECMKRTYYIAIREENWNYAPSGNLVNSDLNEDASVFLSNGPNRIGSVYKKAVYRQYTDDTYSKEIPKPAWLGFLGPILRAEVDDVVEVHMKNFASRPYSLHPHGVFYKKDSEGALYPDGTSGHDKSDDAVAPGQSWTYTWEVKPEYGPTEADASCLTWIYHSHGDAPKDIASGLIGALLTCKKGTLNSSNKRSDVDEDFILMFSVVDENLSWYLEENIETFCSESDETKELMDSADEDFRESNLMHSINGYVYGNLPSLKVCVGRPVSWHLFGIGNEVDIHSAYFHGHTLMDRMHRTDVLSLFPATFVTATMIPRTPGKWLLSCQVNDHIKAGMQGFYEVSICGSATPPSEAPGTERRFYIAAEEMDWNYAPSGKNYMENETSLLTAQDSDSEPYFSRDGGKLGGTYRKARYISYTDETFTTKTHIAGSDKHLGILGPVIRAETGDVIIVTFLNKATQNYSIQPHGLHYEKAYEGAKYQDGTQKDGASVARGKRFTYHWRVIEGPSADDPPCLSYLYYSAVDPVRDSNSGLFGPIQVCNKGVLDGSGHQHADKIQHEFFLLFSVMDENESWYLEQNIETFGSADSDPNNDEFQESNKMHAVNGYMYGNLRGLDLCNGEHVVWHTLGLGTEVDIHGIYFEGNTFQRDGMNRDTLSIFPHTTVTVSMTPDNNGEFELSCRTTDHYKSGMRQHYTVKTCLTTPVQERFTSPVSYYIAAEEVFWNYAPNRTWELEKHMATLEDSPGSIYLEQSDTQIGAEYKKVVFREYTDGTFTIQKTRRPDEEHLGIMGPILRAEVGERIQVVFKNKASRPYSVHAHGVKTSEPHQNGVPPGQMLTYNWTIPERSGPGRNDPNCITFAYYSSVSFVEDLMSGLVGPLIVCRKGTLDTARRRKDVDKEFALLFMVFDENESHYLDENIKLYIKADKFDKYSEGFMERNKMHGINGKMYANLHGLNMKEKDKTEWYLLGLGNEVDMHTVHFHGQSFIYKMDHSHRADVYDLFPGTFQTIELTAGIPGQWLLHCHVTDHIHAGMEALLTVHSKGSQSTRISDGKNLSSAFSHFGSLYMMLCALGSVLLSLVVTH